MHSAEMLLHFRESRLTDHCLQDLIEEIASLQAENLQGAGKLTALVFGFLDEMLQR